MQKIVVKLAVCLMFISTATFAQETPEKTLKEGVNEYYTLLRYTQALKLPINSGNEAVVKMRLERGTQLLDKVEKQGNADQIKTARYFKTLFQNERGRMHVVGNNFNAAYSVFKGIENSMTNYKPSDFPLSYKSLMDTQEITWEMFQYDRVEFFTNMGEANYGMLKYDDAYIMFKNVVAHKDRSRTNSDWLHYAAVHRLLAIRAKQKSLISDKEYCEYALESMKAYAAFSKEKQQQLAKSAYPTWKQGYTILDSVLKDNKGIQNMANTIGEAGQILRGVNENEKAAKFFSYALKNNWGTPTIWQNDVLPTARIEKDSTLGIAVLERLASTVEKTTDCDSLAAFSTDYTQFGNDKKAANFKKKAETCRRQKDADAKRAAEESKKTKKKD
jgi:tetratricopeptide (TPR) repeat protein